MSGARHRSPYSDAEGVIVSNVKVFVLMAAMTAIFVAVGGALGGTGGAWIALGLSLVMNFFAYFNSSKMVLKAYKARTVSPQEAPDLYATVDRLRQQAGLPMPTVAIAPHRQPNAFAKPGSSGSICLSLHCPS